MVVHPSPVVLPRLSTLKREPPRRPDQRQADYMTKFDSQTLFYDVFHSRDRIELSGPPLLNLHTELRAGAFTDPGGEVLEAQLGDLDRTQRSSIAGDCKVRYVHLTSPNLSISISIGQDLSDVFAGHRVLFTKSKNNKLSWIRDWAQFHIATQGIDSVLIYDNGSTDYSPEDILEALQDVAGLLSAVIVDWPFPFGPQGGSWDGLTNAPWDSDFCEYGIMEHARRRFLSDAAGVINADVDELVVTDADRTVFDVLDASPHSVVSYTGRWIETAADSEASASSFADYVYLDTRRPATTAKWAAVPAEIREAIQWKTHWVNGAPMDKTSSVMHRHFMGINSNWKRDRTGHTNVDVLYHKVDEVLLSAFNRANLQKSVKGHLSETVRSSSEQVGWQLAALKEYLASSGDIPHPISRLWFYSPNCLVVDYRWHSRRIAFDIVLENDNLIIKLLGRTTSDFQYITDVLKGSGTLRRGGKYLINIIPTTNERFLDLIAETINNIYRRGQMAFSTPS
ncbi:hypothetical protein [Arthrobacter sp. A5]|uniref:hypothetical protein n=1 Tax=Arthrobacter sp. A5 TaxID=576926 RepID=UPI003DA9D66A